MTDLCAHCKKEPAHPEAFGLCSDCDDLPHLNAFALETQHVGRPDSDRTTRDLLEQHHGR